MTHLVLLCWRKWLISAGTGNKVEDFGVGFIQNMETE
jgi:hypothetical protein